MIEVVTYGVQDGPERRYLVDTAPGEEPTVRDIVGRLRHRGDGPGLDLDRSAVVVNGLVSTPGQRLRDGDEVVLLPYVEGG